MNNLDLNGKSLLITGGTGSLGNALTKTILQKWPAVKRLIIFSRDEQKQFQMAQDYPPDEFPQIRFFIGDVSDKERIVVSAYVHMLPSEQAPARVLDYNPNMKFLVMLLDTVERLAELYRQDKLPRTGLVLNGVKSGTYGYGYRYGYGSGYYEEAPDGFWQRVKRRIPGWRN